MKMGLLAGWPSLRQGRGNSLASKSQLAVNVHLEHRDWFKSGLQFISITLLCLVHHHPMIFYFSSYILQEADDDGGSSSYGEAGRAGTWFFSYNTQLDNTYHTVSPFPQVNELFMLQI